MNTTNRETGYLAIRLRWQSGQAAAVTVQLKRPPVTQLLCGRTADEALRLVPWLFSVCGKAQGVAARLALAAAVGMPTTARVEAAVLTEARREHLWRLLLDWPPVLGLPRRADLFASSLKALNCGDNVCLPALRQHGQALLAALAHLADGNTRAIRYAQPFAPAAPQTLPDGTLNGTLTGPLARNPAFCGLPFVAACVTARLHELEEPEHSPQLGLSGAAPTGPNDGVAWVETARGRLLHRVGLHDGRIRQYEILAPTDWNFASNGPLQQALSTCHCADLTTWRGITERVVLALDPCLPYELVIEPT